MPKSAAIELVSGERIPILYEDRSVLAVDKPAGWLLAPLSWQQTGRNLFAALVSGIAAGEFWARCRNLRYLRHVHRLDADASGALLLAKSPGALEALSRLFESRSVEKVYWAVVQGQPSPPNWVCRSPLGPDAGEAGLVRIDLRDGKDAETNFRLLATRPDAVLGQLSLVEARPLTGRTHQIRVHLASGGYPILNDPLYGRRPSRKQAPRAPQEPEAPGPAPGGVRPAPEAGPRPSRRDQGLALRAFRLAYRDPFSHRSVRIAAPMQAFAPRHGWPELPGEAG